MRDLNLLFEDNSTLTNYRLRIDNARIEYNCVDYPVNDSSIEKIIRFSNYIIERYRGIGIPIHFTIQEKFVDKLTYIIFECICAFLIQNGFPVSITFRRQEAINIVGAMSSPLLLLFSSRHDNIEKFNSKFNFDIYGHHYRKILTMDDMQGTDILSRTLDDIADFQKMFEVEDEYRESISEVLVELVGNAGEHGESDCLIDFDIAPNYQKKGEQGEYIGINIAIVNFSHILFGTPLKNKILDNQQLDQRHLLVKQAYLNHERYFDLTYTSEDFFTIASFQHKISSRRNNNATGGTGLTMLIKSLETRSDAHMCYIQSGFRRFAFLPQFLRYDENGWIGFNSSNNFVSDSPEKGLFIPSKFFFPGTCYNLNFVMRRI